MSGSPVELKVLTFNLWGIFNSKMREERMAHFAAKIEHYDIILLQEQFDPTDFAMMESMVPEHVRKTRYFRRFPSGFYGSGCAVISRFPITSAFFHIYPLQGYPEMVLHGDFFANKGAALVKVAVPIEKNGALVNQEVILYTTHLVAVYQKVSQMSSWKKERYLPYRISQAMSLAEFIINTSKPTDYIIIGGDFNSSQRSLEVQMMLIMLKRKGYDLRSVLPTPGTLLEQARSEQEAEQARSMFTYSYRNAFNASKTSYFKLLKLEADIPSQIDHIFFNAAAFTLRPFPDCPDANPSFPFEIDAEGSGKKAPTGVVVFTKNEVARMEKPSLLERWANALRRRGRNDPQSAFTRIANALSAPKKETPAVPPPTSGTATGASFPADDALTRFPISDHFGVACRLEMHPALRAPGDSSFSSTAESEGDKWQHVAPPEGHEGGALAPKPVPLGEEELLVVNNVERFLTGFANKLRYQVKVTRVMAAISVSVVALNIWAIRRAAAVQEQRTAATLKQLYQLANDGASLQSGKARGKGTTSVDADDVSKARASAAKEGTAAFTEQVASATGKAVEKVVGWANKGLGAVGLHLGGDKAGAATATKAEKKTTTVSTEASGVAVVPDFVLLAKELSMRPFWSSLGISTAVSIAGSVIGLGSFAIGMFQRKGNANILAEQVRLISPSAQRQEAAQRA